jgi:hypothetical protein
MHGISQHAACAGVRKMGAAAKWAGKLRVRLPSRQVQECIPRCRARWYGAVTRQCRSHAGRMENHRCIGYAQCLRETYAAG